jgi:hypothetical protein
MSENNKQSQENKEQPILSVIQQLKDGQIDPETINKDLRQQCIEMFQKEGYSISQMAQIFQKSEKTIKRDIDKIWDMEKVGPSIELVKKLAGEFIAYWRIHRDHLMRLARSKDASVSEKAQAEYYAHRATMEFIEKFQTLGYLPLKPKTIVGDFTYNMNVNDEKSIDDLKMQLVEIEKLALEQGGLAPEIEIEVKRLKKRIEQVEIEKDILKITDKQKKEQEND